MSKLQKKTNEIITKIQKTLMQFWCSFQNSIKTASKQHQNCIKMMQFWCSFENCIKTASKLHQNCIIVFWIFLMISFVFFGVCSFFPNKSLELGFGNVSLCSFLQSMEVASGKIHQGLTEVKFIHQVQSQVKFTECSLKSISWSPVSSKFLWSPIWNQILQVHSSKVQWVQTQVKFSGAQSQ